MVVYLNGKYVEARDAKISAFDPAFLYGDGIFETLRTYKGEIWEMNEHLERLYESARMRGWELTWKPEEIAKNQRRKNLIQKKLRKLWRKRWGVIITLSRESAS